jgi:5-methylcytosine-specific restriction enzyme A
MGTKTQKPRLTSLASRVSTVDTRRGAPVAVKRIVGRALGRIRGRIGLRDEYTCQICGRAAAHGEVDHKTPLHLGGSNSPSNLQWLCKDCHDLKTIQEVGAR